MKSAAACGISPLEFYEMTPYEVGVAVEGYNENFKRDITLAYYTGVFSKSDKPHNVYKEIMSKLGFDDKKEMTDEELLQASLAAFGGMGALTKKEEE